MVLSRIPCCVTRNGTAGTAWYGATPPASTNYRAAAPLSFPPSPDPTTIPSRDKPPSPRQWRLPANLLPAPRQQPSPARGNVPFVSFPGCTQWALHNAQRRPQLRQPCRPGGRPSSRHPAHAQHHHESVAPQPEQKHWGRRHGLQAQPRWTPISGHARERARREGPPSSNTTGTAAAATASAAAAGGSTLQESCHHARVSSRGAANANWTDSR